MAIDARQSQRAYLQAQAAVHRCDAESRRWGLWRCAPVDTGAKIRFEFPSMLPLLSSPLAYLLLPPFHSFEALCHQAPITLAASCGVGTLRLQRPSLRAGLHTRHPMLSASFDESGQAYGRRPHLYDGLPSKPGNATGRLHQPQGRSLMQHHTTAYTSVRAAPAGMTPVSRQRQSAMSHLRATATIPRRRTRVPPPPKRSRNQHLSALSGWSRPPLQAHSLVIQRPGRFPDLVRPWSRALSPL
jgi:hypothetical protein